MLEDVLQTLAAVASLAGVLVVTADPAAPRLAARLRRAGLDRSCAARAIPGAVLGAASALAATRGLGLLTVPGDVPLVTPDDIRAAARRACAPAPASPSCRRATISARTRCCARPPMRCRCASATTASSRILRRPRAHGIEPHDRAAAADRARHRHAGRSGAVPGDAVGNAGARAARSSRPARRRTHGRKSDRMTWRDVIGRALAGDGAIARRGDGARRLRRSRRADGRRPRRCAIAATARASPIRARCSSR